MKITFENKIFQIKYKAITLKRFSPLFYLKENPKACLSSIDKYFRKYGKNVYHPGMQKLHFHQLILFEMLSGKRFFFFCCIKML